MARDEKNVLLCEAAQQDLFKKKQAINEDNMDSKNSRYLEQLKKAHESSIIDDESYESMIKACIMLY